jgi:hypothetical protein
VERMSGCCATPHDGAALHAGAVAALATVLSFRSSACVLTDFESPEGFYTRLMCVALALFLRSQVVQCLVGGAAPDHVRRAKPFKDGGGPLP